MIPRDTMTKVALTLAYRMFINRCDMMDGKIEAGLEAAFKDEKISKVRKERMLDKFSDSMLGKDGEVID